MTPNKMLILGKAYWKNTLKSGFEIGFEMKYINWMVYNSNYLFTHNAFGHQILNLFKFLFLSAMCKI